MVEGRRLVLVTDHKPLIYLFTTKKSSAIQRRAHQIEYLAQFTNEIIHISGVSNVVADCMSRLDAEISAIHAPVTMKRIAEVQKNDQEIARLMEQGYKDVPFEWILLEDSNKVACATNLNKR